MMHESRTWDAHISFITVLYTFKCIHFYTPYTHKLIRYIHMQACIVLAFSVYKTNHSEHLFDIMNTAMFMQVFLAH